METHRHTHALACTHAHACAHTRTHAHKHTRTNARVHTQSNTPRTHTGAFVHFLDDHGGGTPYRASSFVVHPKYDTVSGHNDIAIVFLSQCVVLGDSVQPIQLATPEGEALASSTGGSIGRWQQGQGLRLMPQQRQEQQQK